MTAADQNITQPTVYTLDGWTPPAWATAHRLDEAAISWTRSPDTIPIGEPTSPGGDQYPVDVTIGRYDSMAFDPAAGTLTLEVGATLIRVDDTEMTPAEARKLAAALVELADAADRLDEIITGGSSVRGLQS